MARTLDIIPVLHNEADLGSVAASVRHRMGEAAWAERQHAIEAFWQAVTKWAAKQDPIGLRVYQDGLPVTDEAARIVRELAAKGSTNHQVVSSLITRGGELVGTESPELLVSEYELAKGAAEAAAAGRLPDPRHEARQRTLLEQRDRFIAGRIDETLPSGGRGMLFIGLLHSVEPHLPDDIETRRPLEPPSAKAAG